MLLFFLFFEIAYLVNQSSVAWDTIQYVCQMAQTLFSRCTWKLSRSVFIQMTHHQLVFYETTHGPLKQPNDIKTTRPTWIMNNRLCSLPGLIKMKEMVIWFKKSYSCLYQICLRWSRGRAAAGPAWTLFAVCCIDFSKAVVCFTRAAFCIKGLNSPHYSIRDSIIKNHVHSYGTCLIFELPVCIFAN